MAGDPVLERQETVALMSCFQPTLVSCRDAENPSTA